MFKIIIFKIGLIIPGLFLGFKILEKAKMILELNLF